MEVTPDYSGPDDEDHSMQESLPKQHIIVYEGFLTQLITGQLNLSVPYYTKILTALKAMGCIRQLRRGGSTTKSQWELIYEPTVEAFTSQAPPKKLGKSSSLEKWEAYEQQIRDLSGRIDSLEKWQRDINKTLMRKLGAEPAQEAS